MSINNNLRLLRLESGMTQEQVAQKIGISRQALSSYESGRTRPDIDMLMHLSEVYGTDLEGIIYGRSQAQKALRRVKVTAVFTYALLAVLTAVSSAFLCCANNFFAISEGQLSKEEMLIFASRRRLTGAWETTDKIILTISFLGFLLLLIFLAAGKCKIPLKVKLTYMAALAAAIFAIAILFGFTDPVFKTVDYIITPFLVVVRMIFFFLADLIIGFVQKKRRG